MLRNYWKMAIRSLLKRKGYSLINILGLAIGMAVCGLILFFIHSELGYDYFLPNGDRVYRLVMDRQYPGRVSSYADIAPSIGEAVHREFPEVEAVTGLVDATYNDKSFIKAGDKIFEVQESHIFLADTNFFRVFPSRMLEGDPITALKAPFTAVLTERTAKKYFGSAAAALGKVLLTDDSLRFTVSAVCSDLPDNSHLAYDILYSAASFPSEEPSYTGFSTYTYLLLKKNADPAVLGSKLPMIVDKYISATIGRSFDMTYPQWRAAGNDFRFHLQPVRSIHLQSDLEGEIRPNGSMRAIYIFAIIAAFILSIACINFINLSTARSAERAKEVGIRKTFGSDKRSLVLQFLTESVLVGLLSAVLSLLLIWALLPIFSQLSGKEISLRPFLSFVNLIGLLLFGTTVGIAAGIYPAFVLSSFRPIKVLTGKFKSGKYGAALRNGLVVFQFAISIVLIICTITVNRQMQYMLSDGLGFRKDHIIEIERSDMVVSAIPFRTQLASVPGVEMVSATYNLPGGHVFATMSWQPFGSRQTVTGRGLSVDDHFASLLDLKIKEGRFFSRDFSTDTLSIVLNEKAVIALGLKEPVVGARLASANSFYRNPDGTPYIYHVIGVIRDFRYQSLHEPIAPLFFTEAYKYNGATNLTAVRVKGDHFGATIRGIEKTWRKFVQDWPFRYSFLDQRLANQYRPEETQRQIFTLFSGLAIFIACIGLLGLAAYATQQRLREISIRKVLGAGTGTIVRMLSVHFLRLVIVSALVACPVAWLAMHAWLRGFVYHVALSWWIFALACALCLVITLLTTGFQAIRAALTNPVKILRSE